MRKVGAGLALALLVVACSDDGSDDSTSDTSNVEDGAVPQLTFDGTECTYEGPAEVAEGAVAVEYVNASDGGANIEVQRFEAGHTVAEVVEYLDDPTKTAEGGPSWLSDMGGVPPADPGETITWEGDLDAGDYLLVCTESVGGSPWAAGAVTVGSGLVVTG